MAVELRSVEDQLDKMYDLGKVTIKQITSNTSLYEHDFDRSMIKILQAKIAIKAISAEHSKLTKALKKAGVTMVTDAEFNKNLSASRSGGGPSR